MLYAWLKQREGFGTKMAHVWNCAPTLAERQAAREELKGLLGENHPIFEKEWPRDLAAGEPEEPLE